APVTGAVVLAYKVYRDSGFIAQIDTETYTDSIVAGTYTYYVTAMYTDNESVPSNEVVVEVTGIDNPFVSQKNVSVTNYPNPFNSETTISYIISVSSNVIIEIYNIQGKKIKTLVNKYKVSGNHSVVWNGNDYNGKIVSSGIYYCRLRAVNSLITKKMIIIQ
ncbi:MAG: T9SS type A sorting domain-containing protein, partial [Bacteroidales bacterium]|nr:T9SS type A sorting domain-containing protein [Bacteroidales bacterium]